MNKKGQAAMEFLMTYGWAILVVLAAIAALAYFGVLSPQKLLPERTTFSAPLPNIDNAVVDTAANSVEIAFKNNVGVSITLTDVAADGSGTVVAGSIVPGTGVTCDNPRITATLTNTTPITDTMQIANGDGFLVKWDCTDVGTVKVGDKFKADSIYFSYKNVETGQTRKHSGSVDGKYQ